MINGSMPSLEEVRRAYPWLTIPTPLKKYVSDNYDAVPYDATNFLKEVSDIFNSKTMMNLSHNYRATMGRFVRDSARGAGTSNVHNAGKYVVGEIPPGYNLAEQAKRHELMFTYARACAEGLNKTAKDYAFKHNDNDEYDTMQLAQIAIEMESASSKGPYDNGFAELPFKVVETNLENAYTEAPISDEYIALYLVALAEFVRPKYLERINRSKKFEYGTFKDSNAKRGTSSTLRGSLNAHGDSAITFSQVLLYKWMFSHIRDKKFDKVTDAKSFRELCWITTDIKLPAKGKSKQLDAYRKQLEATYKVGVSNSKFSVLSHNGDTITIQRPYTVDEFIDVTNIDFFEVKKLSVYDLISDKLFVYNNLMRDQGSPFKTIWKNGELFITGEQKEQKIRMVEPVNAWIQSWLDAAGSEIVDIAPHLRGREGMLDPLTNNRKMDDAIKSAWLNDMYYENFDLSKFDSTIVQQLATPAGLMYASLYDDPNVKATLECLGLFSMRKFIIVPKLRSSNNPIWSKYQWAPIRSIKGDRDYTLRSAADKTTNASLKKQILEARAIASQGDYNAVVVFIPNAWEPSGIYFTNTMESDVNQAISAVCMPIVSCMHEEISKHAELVDALRQKLDPMVLHASTSGDDITVTMLLIWLKRLGLDAVRRVASWAYHKYNWVLNDAKMSRVTYKVEHKGEVYYVPPMEFLQKVRFQNGTDAHFPDHSKFSRMWFGAPYTEHATDLLPIAQNSIPNGRFNSSLSANDDDIKFAAKVIVNSSVAWNRLVQNKHLKVKLTPNDEAAIRKGDWATFNPDCVPGKTQLMGYETYFGLVKKYDDQLDGAITKHVMLMHPDKVDASLKKVIKELELRAPHRVGMVNAILDTLTEEERHFFLSDMQPNEIKGFQQIGPLLLKEIENLGVKVKPLDLQSLEKSQGLGSSVTSESAQADDSVDDYEDD